MSWRAIAEKDFLDAVRSRGVWILVGLFALVLVVIAYGAQLDDATDVDQFVEFTAVGFTLFVPLVGVVLGYKSVIDERESGTIALALSFPHTRLDFVTGKFAGRSLVLTIPILIGMGIASVLVLALYESFPLVEYLGFTVLNVVLGLAFLSIALGLSMALASGRRVTAGAFGAYVVLAVLWTDLVEALLLVLWRFDGQVLVDPPDWSWFAQLSSPVESYNRIVTALFDSDLGATYTQPDAPWFVDAWVAPLVLLAWIVLPFALGYLRFRRTEL